MRRPGLVNGEVRIQKRGADECWPWAGPFDKDGYGRANSVLAHRFAYELYVGPIPEGMTVDHACWTRHCCNPAHLGILTHSENARRQRLALRTHCKHGHEFTPENTARGVRGRICRKCQAAATRRYLARKRAAATAVAA